MTKWSFSQNIVLIINHLDLIFYYLLPWFHFKGRNKNKEQILHKWRVGLFCQHTKKGQLDKPQEKASNTLKMPYCHLAREIKGLQHAVYKQVSGENESALHTEEESWTVLLNLQAATQTALTPNKEGPWGKLENSPSHSKVQKHQTVLQNRWQDIYTMFSRK